MNMLNKIKFRNKAPRVLSEEEYYQNLFIENENWNTALPNAEEVLRWKVIENFLYYIKGYVKSNTSKEKIKIVDVGCGRGWLANLLTKYGEVLGIEPVKAVVEYGKSLFPQLDLQIGSTSDLLRSKNNKFDIVVFSEVIEHIEDEKKQQFINDFYELLNDGGFVILTTPRKEVQNEWLKYVNANQPIEEWLDEQTIEKLFTSNNFVTHLKERLKLSPSKGVDIDVYQLWVFQKS